MIRLYNTKDLQVEEFKPIHEGHVDMYVCGPTVYNYAHIGNARPMVVFDVLKRLFEAEGYTVKYVSNFTDVDDKIINKAIEENVSESVITDRYIKAYQDLIRLRHSCDALVYGSFHVLDRRHDRFVYLRRDDEETYLIDCSFSAEKQEPYPIHYNWTLVWPSCLYDHKLGPYGARIWKRIDDRKIK